MSPFKKIVLMAVMGIFVFTSAGFAAMLSGKVVSFDPSARKLTLSTLNPASGESQNTEIWVDADAQLEGLSALGEIKQGDSLWVETETDSEGNLRAHKINRA